MLTEAYFFFNVTLSNNILKSKNLFMKEALIMCALFIGFSYSYMKIVIFI